MHTTAIRGRGKADAVARSLLFLAAGAGTLLAGKIALASIPISPIAHHMSVHILIVSVVARLIALGMADLGRDRFFSGGASLVAASVTQVAAIWALHVPKVLAATMANTALHSAAQAALLVAAVWFWLAIAAQKDNGWRAIVALLVSGKLVCLLAVLLVFAPRFLYPMELHHGMESGLADQQLAGLLMIVACPVTYIVAAIAVAARVIGRVDSAHTRIVEVREGL